MKKIEPTCTIKQKKEKLSILIQTSSKFTLTLKAYQELIKGHDQVIADLYESLSEALQDKVKSQEHFLSKNSS
jgi:hypothetical protein